MRATLSFLVVGLLASRAGATPAACRDAVVAEAARYTQATVKAIVACARKQAGDCDTDARTVSALARAHARLHANVAQRCCGADGICGTADDDPLAAAGWGAGF